MNEIPRELSQSDTDTPKSKSSLPVEANPLPPGPVSWIKAVLHIIRPKEEKPNLDKNIKLPPATPYLNPNTTDEKAKQEDTQT